MGEGWVVLAGVGGGGGKVVPISNYPIRIHAD